MPNLILKINHPKDKIHQSENICCYMADASLPDDVLGQLVATEKMLLLCGENAAEKARAINAGGVVAEIDSKQPIKIQIRPLRESLGTKKILGVVINPTRHEAMLAAEPEPEFVAFRLTAENASVAQEIIKWYNELFLIQSAVDLSAGLVDIKGFDVDFVIINSNDYDDFSC